MARMFWVRRLCVCARATGVDPSIRILIGSKYVFSVVDLSLIVLRMELAGFMWASRLQKLLNQ